MQLHTHLIKSILGKTILAAGVFGGLLLFGGASSAQANEWHDRDDRRIVRYDDRREHEVFEHRGYYSPRAEYLRHERREALEHGWFDRFGCWHRY
jgi:hypothetical protein